MGARCIKLEIPSRCLGRTAGGCLVLPGAEREARRSLVLLHGAQESPETVLENCPVAALAEELGLAVLLPELGNSFGLDWGAGQDYRSFLLRELLDTARARCPAFAGRDRCAVGGISMGGFAALSLALDCPERFGRAFSLSGALDLKRAAQISRISGFAVPDGLSAYAARPEAQLLSSGGKARADHPKPALYLAWGEDDWFAAANAAFSQSAAAAGCAVRVETGPGLHDWAYWRESLPPAVRWAAA